MQFSCNNRWDFRIDLARNGNSGCANETSGCAKCLFWWKSPWIWKNCGNFRVCKLHHCLCKTQVHRWLAKTMDFQKCPCNSHPTLTRQFSSNSHLQFSSNSHLQFSSNFHLTILIQFSPDNYHPILTWQFSSSSHLQFSLNSHQRCSLNSHQQCSYNFLVMISQSVLISHAVIFVQCWFYNGVTQLYFKILNIFSLTSPIYRLSSIYCVVLWAVTRPNMQSFS